MRVKEEDGRMGGWEDGRMGGWYFFPAVGETAIVGEIQMTSADSAKRLQGSVESGNFVLIYLNIYFQFI